MRVLVFEQWQGGHYFNYINYLLPRLSELASEVVVAMTKDALASSDFVAKFNGAQVPSNIRFEGSVPKSDASLPARERFNVYKNLLQAIDRTNPDYVLVPSADAQTWAMGALGHFGIRSIPKGITTEGTFHCGYGPAVQTTKHFLKESAYRFAYSGCSWTRMNFVNFLYYEHAIARSVSWAPRARLIPDPVVQSPRMSRSEARAFLGIPMSGRYVGLLGSLDRRKAIPELLAAYRSAKLGDQDRLLLAGQMDQSFRDLISSSYGDLVQKEKLVIIDRYLTDDEVTKGYGALDLVCTAYIDFPGLASLMLKGIAAGRPIITHNFGWSSALVRRFSLGTVCDIFNPASFAQALSNALDTSSAYQESAATKRLLQFHQVSNFTETMLDHIRQQTGSPERCKLLSWEWVLEALPPERRSIQ